MSEMTPQKQLARLKRQATEIAGQIHDVVEDSLWTDYAQIPELSVQLVAACEKVKKFKMKM